MFWYVNHPNETNENVGDLLPYVSYTFLLGSYDPFTIAR
jgi:hypothetical protein